MAKSRPRNGETFAECLTRRREEWAENSEKLNELRRFNYVLQKDEVNRKRRETEAQNRDSVRQKLKEDYIKHAFKRRASASANANERRHRVPPWCQKEQILLFYKNCPKGYEVDHIIPLLGQLVSGLHVIENLQYLTVSENRAKRNKYEVQA